MTHLTAFLCLLARRGHGTPGGRGASPLQAGRNAASGQTNTASGGAKWVIINDLWYYFDRAAWDAELVERGRVYGPPAGGLPLALEGDRPAGCVALRPLAVGAGEVKRLFVAAPDRGRGLTKKGDRLLY